MSNFFKSAIVCLTIGIVITSFMSQKEAEAANKNEANSAIVELENDIKGGLIVEDGILVKDDEIEFKKNDGNVVSDTAGAIGSGVTSLVGKVLKFFANLISGLIS